MCEIHASHAVELGYLSCDVRRPQAPRKLFPTSYSGYMLHIHRHVKEVDRLRDTAISPDLAFTFLTSLYVVHMLDFHKK